MKPKRCTGLFDCNCANHKFDRMLFELRANETHNRVRRLLGWPEVSNVTPRT